MNDLYLSVGYTLVDMTNTGIIANDTIERNQQRNWETAIQVLGLRTQLMFLRPPVVRERNVAGLHFGSDYTGIHRVWEFKFGIEFASVFADSVSAYGTLERDFTNVPIITGLSETAAIALPTFIVSGNQKNIFFEEFGVQ